MTPNSVTWPVDFNPFRLIAELGQAGDNLNPQPVQAHDQEAREEDFVEVADAGKNVGDFAEGPHAEIGKVAQESSTPPRARSLETNDGRWSVLGAMDMGKS
jgi:hypothetical protein